MGEALGYRLLPEQAVIHLPLHVLHMGSEQVKPLVVCISGDLVALRVGEVTVAAEGGDEGGELAAPLVYRHRVVPLPGVRDHLVGVLGDSHGLQVGGEDRVCVAEGSIIQPLHVHCPAG